jgi:crotonobetainyl-CoA:carnitine CoA-transferase CaiB-like acyl-CoA transferase
MNDTQTKHTSPIDIVAAPLEGVRVLDLVTGPMGAIGRTLSEFGAYVVRIEPPGGSSDRKVGLRAGGVGLAFTAANLGKRGLELNLKNLEGRQTLEELAAVVDIVLEDALWETTAARELYVARWRERNPALVVLSISDFGCSSFSAWHATDPVLHALSGGLSRSGMSGRPPLLPPGELAIQSAAAQGLYVTLAAFLNRLRTGIGDHLDLSLLDACTQALDPGYGIAGSATAGRPASKLPRGRPEARFQYPIIPCKDGFVRICVLSPRQWQGMFDWMGRPPEFADPSFNQIWTRYKSKSLIPAIADFFADKTRSELEEESQQYGVPTTGVLTLKEALGSEQIRARSALAPAPVGTGYTALFPNGVLLIDGIRAGIQGAAPAVGAHQAEVLALLSVVQPSTRWPGPQSTLGSERPFAGLRVLDLGVIVVGAEHGRLLADLGADVVKLEAEAFPDGSRQTGDGSLISASFAAGHRNKRSMGLNLRAPEGRDIFFKLAAKADVIFSNFKPGTLQSLGLGPAELLNVNPRLIIVDSSAFGATGPWSRRMGYGPLVRAATGLTAQWRYPDDATSFSDAMTVYPDHVAGRIGVAAVLALLIRRLRTGRGGTISVSQTEVMLSQAAAEIAALTLQPATSSLDVQSQHDVPWGVFQCSGDDEWCVVSSRGDEDWQALCQVIDRLDLLQDPNLATLSGRRAERARIDEAVTAWLSSRSARQAMEELQRGGVPAGAMLRVVELPHFPYFEERHFFRLFHQDRVNEPFPVENGPVHWELIADPPLRSAPVMGQHTRQIAQEWLGMNDQEISDLYAAKIFEGPGMR